MIRRTYISALILSLLAAHVAPAVSARPAVEMPTQAPEARDLPFELNANHIYVRASVNRSRPLWFLFDTGAEMSVIDAGVAASLGLLSSGSATARGAGEGTAQAGFAQGVTLSVGRATAADQTVVTLPLDALEPVDGRAIDGILGHDFIARFVVTVDYARRRISLVEPGRFDPATAPGERVPITIDGGIPRLAGSVVIDGAAPIAGEFTIDTGSRTALSFNAPFVQAHPAIRSLAGRALDAPYGFGIGGATKTRVGRIPALRIGGVAILRPVVGFSFDSKGVDATDTIAGNIGGDLLRRFRVTFDYGRGMMYFESTDGTAEPFRYDAFGAMLSLDGSAFLVRRVVPGSPAAAAGVREGDRIVAIDGRPTAGTTLEAARQRFLDAGSMVRLRLARKALEWNVGARLRSLV